jgi:hypothetical protein
MSADAAASDDEAVGTVQEQLIFGAESMSVSGEACGENTLLQEDRFEIVEGKFVL